LPTIYLTAVNGTAAGGGTAVFPDPADVVLGVTYGPTGIEFTGTMTSGGGSVYLRRG
jgi:hypothetical protein